MFCNFFNILNIADYIQLAILIALIWYSLETRQLRKWQKKQTQLTILELEMQRKMNLHNGQGFGRAGVFPDIIRNIYEVGKFDPRVLYAPPHPPLTIFGKLKQKVTKLFKKK